MTDDFSSSNNSQHSWATDIALFTRQTSPQITYVSAPCGSGKTYNLADYFAEIYRNADFEEPAHLLYVGLSNDLINSFSQRLTDLGVTNQRVITAKNVGSDVVRQVTAHLKDPSVHQGSHVLLITHQTFLRLPVSARSPTRWMIFIDEIPQLDSFQLLNLTKSRRFLRGLFQADAVTERLSRITAESPTKLRELLDLGDTGISAMRDILEKVLSRTHIVYTGPEEFDRFDGSADDDKDCTLPLLCVPNPNIFAGCCILGANFEHTILFHYLKKNGRVPVPHAELTSQLRYSHYPSHIGSRTTIKYCLEYRRYSKTIRKELTTQGITVQRAMDRAISGYLGTNRFLLMTNNDDQTDLLKSPHVIRLSGSPHGSNHYDNERYIVFLSALNRSNLHESMLVELGLSKTMIRHTTTIEAAHQAAMRTNLRVPTSSGAVHIIVPDRDTANALGKILGCTNISRLDSIEPQAKSRLDGLLPLTSSDRNKNSIAHKVEQSLLPHKSGNGSGDFSSRDSLRFPLNSGRNSNDFWSEVDGPDGRSKDENIFLLFHNSEKVAHMDQLDPRSFTPTSLTAQFEKLARKKVRNKEDVILFNPCMFKGTKDGYGIKEDQNFLSASCLVLDFDNGSLSPDDFIRLFWRQPGDHRKRSFLICNTFSTSSTQPNRFRVIIPFQRPVMSKDVFQAIYDQIVDRLIRSGFTKDQLGLDPGSRSPSQSFYVPCTNRQHPKDAFFESFGMSSREFNRYALNPQGYEQTLRDEDQKPRWFLLSTEKKQLTEGQKSELQQMKFELMSMKWDRNEPLFRFGGTLENLNFSLPEIDAELSDVAGKDAKMIKKKNDFLKRVTKNRSRNPL